MNEFVTSIMENVTFVLSFLGVFAAIVVIAYFFEKMFQRRDGNKGKILTTQKITMIGMSSAIAGILMLFEVPLPVIAPTFYKIDFSEVPIMICGLACGPVAVVLAEFVKIMLNLLFDGTTTAFVGEFANFCVGCSMVLPATILFHAIKKKGSIIRCMVIVIIANLIGVVIMTVFGSFFNAIYLLPAFASLYGMPLETIVEMGTAINPLVKDSYSFAAICVAPLNYIKGISIMGFSTVVYIPIRAIVNSAGAEKYVRKEKKTC